MARISRRPLAAAGRSLPDRPRPRGDVGAAGSAARSHARRRLQHRRGARVHGPCRDVDAGLSRHRSRTSCAFAAPCGDGALRDAPRVWQRTRDERRQGQPVRDAAGRGHPASAGAVPCRLLCVALGVHSAVARRAVWWPRASQAVQGAAIRPRPSAHHWRGARVAALLPAERPRARARVRLSLSRALRRGSQRDRPGRRGRGSHARGIRLGLSDRLSVNDRHARGDVAVTVGKRDARRGSRCPSAVGAGQRRADGHRPGARRAERDSRGTHRHGARGAGRRAGLHRHRRYRADLRHPLLPRPRHRATRHHRLHLLSRARVDAQRGAAVAADLRRHPRRLPPFRRRDPVPQLWQVVDDRELRRAWDALWHLERSGGWRSPRARRATRSRHNRFRVQPGSSASRLRCSGA